MSQPEEPEVDVIVLEDEDGKERSFALLTLVEIDDARYAVLAPVDQLDSDDPDLDLYAFSFTEHEGGDIELDAVEDVELLDKIFVAAEEILFEDDDEDIEE